MIRFSKVLLYSIWVSVIFSTLLLGNALPLARQSKGDFVPDATVVFADGTSLRLSDFAFYSDHYDPSNWWRNESVNERFDLFLVQGDFWKVLQFSEIKKLNCEPDPSNKNRWFMTEVTLGSGKMITGKIPQTPKVTWRSGEYFEFHGKRKILGVEGDFSIRIRKVRSIVMVENKLDTFIFTDDEGKTATVRNPRLWLLGGSGDFGTYERVIKHDNEIEVVVDNTKASLKLNDIDIIEFPEESPDYVHLVKIKMKNREEAACSLGWSVSRIFGKTESGQIWFINNLSKEKKYRLHSIRFK